MRLPGVLAPSEMISAHKPTVAVAPIAVNAKKLPHVTNLLLRPSTPLLSDQPLVSARASPIAQEEVVPKSTQYGNSCLEDMCGSLPPPEFRLYAAIEVVSHLSLAEKNRSLSIDEQSLRDF